MAFSLHSNRFNTFLAVLCSLSMFLSCNYCLELNPNPNNATQIQNETQWLPGTASPMGGGSLESACGYAALEGPEFSEVLVSAGGPSLFKDGNACGTCYEVRCTEYYGCSEKPVALVIADACKRCSLRRKTVDFDLSQSAYVALMPSMPEWSHWAPILNVQYRRVACKFAMSIAATISADSNIYQIGLTLEFKMPDEISSFAAVDIKQAQSDSWQSMIARLDNVWTFKTSSRLKAPFSIMLTDVKNDTTITVESTDLIPANWETGQTYRSVNLRVRRV